METVIRYDLEAGTAIFGSAEFHLHRRIHQAPLLRNLADRIETEVHRRTHRLRLRQPHLRIPLVRNVLIGASGSPEEQARCQGGPLAYMEHEHLEGAPMVYFAARATFNGTKVILPRGVSFFNDVSDTHGELRLAEGEGGFYYVHSTDKLFTTLWDPDKGRVEATRTAGNVLRLGLGFDLPYVRGQTLERLLLLGGVDTETKPRSARPIDKDYLGSFFYIRVLRRS